MVKNQLYGHNMTIISIHHNYGQNFSQGYYIIIIAEKVIYFHNTYSKSFQ